MCSKQVRGCFWIYSSLINFVRLKCSTTKNACWKQVVGYFLVYLSLISNVRLTFYYKKLVLKASESLACFFSLFIINQEVRRLRFFVCLFVFSFFFFLSFLFFGLGAGKCARQPLHSLLSSTGQLLQEGFLTFIIYPRQSFHGWATKFYELIKRCRLL